MDTTEIVEQVDKRNLWRRAEDVRKNLVLIGLAAVLVAMGIGWGTATAAVSQKVDRKDFVEHVNQSERRFLADSLRNVITVEALHRIELKVDATNERLSALICDKKPSYCK
jgi:hypothetical protein